ncbi:MAG: sulfurtransferase TusA family protein [Methanomassiliicoccus sp.]|nr:sulfurtransferase TusA family protein [Methanomassiliicoccus sp.]
MEILDCCGLECPMPIVHLAKKVKKMKVGEELILKTTAEGSRMDVPIWCKRTGNDLLNSSVEDGIFIYQIKKLR